MDRATGVEKEVIKVKGLSLTREVEDIVDGMALDRQVAVYASKRSHADDSAGPAKRACLLTAQKKAADEHRDRLNEAYAEQGAQAVMSMDMSVCVENGPCTCGKRVAKTSLTVPQVQFRKHKREGFVETVNIQKEYRIVLNKRWLLREHEGQKLPFQLMTLPFGAKKLS